LFKLSFDSGDHGTAWHRFWLISQKNIMKKQAFLIIGLVALYMAAKEYNIHSVEDLKKALSPYLKGLDLEKLIEA
jgi:hypothetical protein